MKKENIIKDKTIQFSIRIIKLYNYVIDSNREHVLARQLLRSGTAIGAMVREAEYAESKLDFIHKLHIALKEANETDYWLILLRESKYISAKEYESIQKDVEVLIKVLISIINTTKQNLKDK